VALGHLGINVPDLGAARRYYGQLLPALGYEPFLDDADQFAHRPATGKRGAYLFFYAAAETVAYSRDATGLQHLAFMVPTRQAVSDAHALAISLGSAPRHAPQAWPQYPPPYFAAFWSDPFGITIEAVCHHDR
jgi:catechol 2,3-dioxygenase-like lactoylglutathione lyase family enzyme